MEIIGLSGFARSGKDVAADLLVEEYGFRRIAFADKLRDMLYALNPQIGIKNMWCNHMAGIDNTMGWNPIYLRDVIDELGWDGYKQNRNYMYEIRRLMQRLGTEAGREVLWDTIWIDAAYEGLTAEDKIVITDARFFNELESVRIRNGYIWRIDRDGIGPANDHASELEAVDYPYFSLRLENNGTLEEYKDLIRKNYESGQYKEWSYS